MRNLIVVLFEAAGREVVEDARYERALAQVRAEVTAIRAEYARASAERRGRFEERLEGTRRELRETRTRLRNGITRLEQERDGAIQRLREQLGKTGSEAHHAIEQRLAELEADYRLRIARLTRAWELAESAITS